MAAQQNLFKKAHAIRKRNPGMSMKDACAQAQGKKVSGAKKLVPMKKAAVGKKPAAAKKKVPSYPLKRQGAPVRVVKKTTVRKVTMGSVTPSRIALEKLNSEVKHLNNYQELIARGRIQIAGEKDQAEKKRIRKNIDNYRDLVTITKQNITNLKRQIR